MLTPFPSTPLYKRLEVAGRLTRPKHWLDFKPFHMAHTPLKMSIEEAHAEMNYAWTNSYSPESHSQSGGFNQPQTAESSHRHIPCAFILSWNLLSTGERMGMDKAYRSEPANNLQALGEAFGIGRKRRKATSQPSDAEVAALGGNDLT